MPDSNPPTDSPSPQSIDAVPAGIGRKLGAWIYDLFLVLGLLVFLGFIQQAILQAIDANLIRENPDYLRESPFQFIALILVVLLYYTINWVRSGRTLGMLAWGLMLVDEHGKTLTFNRALARAAVSLFGAAMLISPFNRRKLGLHDMICNTRVVRLESKARLSKKQP